MNHFGSWKVRYERLWNFKMALWTSFEPSKLRYKPLWVPNIALWTSLVPKNSTVLQWNSSVKKRIRYNVIFRISSLIPWGEVSPKTLDSRTVTAYRMNSISERDLKIAYLVYMITSLGFDIVWRYQFLLYKLDFNLFKLHIQIWFDTKNREFVDAAFQEIVQTAKKTFSFSTFGSQEHIENQIEILQYKMKESIYFHNSKVKYERYELS